MVKHDHINGVNRYDELTAQQASAVDTAIFLQNTMEDTARYDHVVKLTHRDDGDAWLTVECVGIDDWTVDLLEADYLQIQSHESGHFKDGSARIVLGKLFVTGGTPASERTTA